MLCRRHLNPLIADDNMRYFDFARCLNPFSPSHSIHAPETDVRSGTCPMSIIPLDNLSASDISCSVGDILTHSSPITTCGTLISPDVSIHLAFSPDSIGGGVGDSIIFGSAYSRTRAIDTLRLISFRNWLNTADTSSSVYSM